ncbi:hypothetical protein J7T55_013854 [Diaporthe amygdali]|uniref:uncharacterized protein n=1 Tax=Phomopsis amygdali TaxID=1214568 RepID=UPI0022FF3EF1|nr:uncharacterized protein J7T55_013854 [Diaporthe amygdali]KAJ0119651.1 hypothetical protein J7T55_013854 [Diaporthe amygdali]
MSSNANNSMGFTGQQNDGFCELTGPEDKCVSVLDSDDGGDWDDEEDEDFERDFLLGPLTHLLLHRFVEPNPRTSCNVAVAALRKPLSLLTKYKHKKLQDDSKYFHEVFSSHCPRLHRAKLFSRRSPLREVQNVDDKEIC